MDPRVLVKLLQAFRAQNAETEERDRDLPESPGNQDHSGDSLDRNPLQGTNLPENPRCNHITGTGPGPELGQSTKRAAVGAPAKLDLEPGKLEGLVTPTELELDRLHEAGSRSPSEGIVNWIADNPWAAPLRGGYKAYTGVLDLPPALTGAVAGLGAAGLTLGGRALGRWWRGDKKVRPDGREYLLAALAGLGSAGVGAWMSSARKDLPNVA